MDMIAIEVKGKTYEYEEGQAKFSKAGKMPCRSWSLPAIKSCPGSIGEDGDLVDVCKTCYATQGNYVYGNVAAPREFNMQDWKRDDWVDTVAESINLNDLFFRWFDSGDGYALALMWKIFEVMKRTPNTRHWLPTRMYKFAKFAEVLDAMAALPNVVVRLSSDSLTGEVLDTEHNNSTAIPFTKGDKKKGILPQMIGELPEGVTLCEAYTRDGKCGSCRACWDKDTATVGYPTHSQKAGKVLRERCGIDIRVAA